MEIKCQLDLGKVDHKNGMEIPFWKPNNKTTLIGPEIYIRGISSWLDSLKRGK